jgi:hypothetical protein
LIQACQLLDTGFTWNGCFTDFYQRLAMPRIGLIDEDGRWFNQDVIPQRVKDAQYEMALALCQKDRIAKQEPDLLGQGFSHVKVDVIEVDVDKTQVLPIVPDFVIHLLSIFGEPKPGLLGVGGFRQLKLER